MVKTENNKGFLQDMGWYLGGAVVPMAVGFFKTPIFTRYFTPEEYGYLGLIMITFSYISIFLYSWLSSCLWRYYNAYKLKNDLKSLYSNLLAIFVGTSVVLLLITLIWLGLAKQALVKQLIIYSFVQYFIKELIGLYLIVIRLEGKAVKYNLIHSSRAILGFGLLYVMTFGFGYRITSVITSTIVIDLLAFAYIFLGGMKNISVSIKSISGETLRVLFKYGSAGLVAGFSFLLITSSDRYIIALFTDMATVGIYNQAYNISQLSVVALITVYFNTFNPALTRELEVNLKGSDKLISRYLFVYVLFGLPLITYFSIFSKEMAMLLLGEEFRSGYIIMPWVFISAFVYGLNMFIEIKLKFADQIKFLAIGVLLAAGFNIALNFALIPVYGYEMAAITTLVAYLFLFVFFVLRDQVGFFRNSYYLKQVLLFAVVIALQVLADKIIRVYYPLNVFETILEGILFFAVYIFIFRKKIINIKLPV
ncbi:MAG: oligosaccharide flippase family protein [Chlorobi bacterium]|nr:oligosaccharide flippase family protein [Chlorobiota bacterium]